MISSSLVPPAFILIIGALLVPILKGKLRSIYMLLLPVFGYMHLQALTPGTYWTVNFLDYHLILGQVDKLSLIFGSIFHIITFIAIIYNLHSKNTSEHFFGLVYAGSALGVVFAGDLFSMFAFWEMLTICALFMILAGKTQAAIGAAYRYGLVHVVGGLVLLAGIMMYTHETGSIVLGEIGLSSPSTYLIFLGFGLNSAWPLLHSWLPDSYPESSVGGAIFLSALTTKTAVYILIRTFPGAEPLIWIGAVMVTVPMFYALIENDMRRVLSYSLINQVGFMMVAIGIGTELSLNGAAAHAYTHILYKGLLFMSIGAVIHQTGKSKATDLGGLYKSMPFTCICCMIGAASISAFPLFSGFASKSLVMSAAAEGHMIILWFILLFAAAGVFEHAGIKVPFFTFFGHDSGIRVKEAPLNMRIAMGIAAALCILLGVFPQQLLYPFLPYAMNYDPYTFSHVIGQAQLLCFAALAFCFLLLSGLYPAEIRAINLDVDWFYRKGFKGLYRILDKVLNWFNELCNESIAIDATSKVIRFFSQSPAHFSYFVMHNYWLIKGVPVEQLPYYKATLYARFKHDNFRIGFTSSFAVLFILIFFLL